MRSKTLLIVGLVGVWVFSTHRLLGQEAANAQFGKPQECKRKVTSTDRTQWKLPTTEDASERVAQIVGQEKLAGRATSELVTLENDNTPFLAREVAGKPIWQVELRVSLDLEAADSPEIQERTFDVFVDPANGRVLKIISRWPTGVPAIAPMPSAEFAEQCMLKAGNERYHSFPEVGPRVSFMEALNVVYRDGVGNPLIAKQIMGQYVLRSQMDREPRAVWAITLWGIPAVLSRPHVAVEAQNHIRNIVDATTGKWLSAGTSPQPEPRKDLSRRRHKKIVPPAP